MNYQEAFSILKKRWWACKPII